MVNFVQKLQFVKTLRKRSLEKHCPDPGRGFQRRCYYNWELLDLNCTIFPWHLSKKNGELIVDSSSVKAAFERQPFGSDTCAIHSRLAWRKFQSKRNQMTSSFMWPIQAWGIGDWCFTVFLILFGCGYRGSGLNNLLQPKKSSEEAAAKLQMALEAAAKESNQMLYQHPDKQQKSMESTWMLTARSYSNRNFIVLYMSLHRRMNRMKRRTGWRTEHDFSSCVRFNASTWTERRRSMSNRSPGPRRQGM